MLVTREDLSTLPYSVNAILELKKTTSRFKRTYNKAYPVYDSLTASNVQLKGVEKLLTEDANSGYTDIDRSRYWPKLSDWPSKMKDGSPLSQHPERKFTNWLRC